MGLIKKPSELEPKKTLSVLIYGVPGSGKSTMGCSAPNTVLLDFDGGVNRINVAHQVPTVQVHSWSDIYPAIDEIKREYPSCKSIVIDTCGKMLDFMSDDIMSRNPRMRRGENQLTLQGFGERKGMFQSFLSVLMISGLNVIFIAHEKEDKRGDDTFKRPEVGGSSYSDLMKELDLVGYLYIQNGKRIISFEPNEFFYAKNSCHLPKQIEVPELFDAQGNPSSKNAFIKGIIDLSVNYQLDSRKKLEAYDAVMKDIDEIIGAIDDVETLTDATESIGKKEHILDSKAQGLAKLQTKAAELGYKWNGAKKAYVPVK